jgi:hypothetical protein
MVSEDPERGSGEVTATQETFLTRDTGPAVEQEIVRDMIGRAAVRSRSSSSS